MLPSLLLMSRAKIIGCDRFLAVAGAVKLNESPALTQRSLVLPALALSS